MCLLKDRIELELILNIHKPKRYYLIVISIYNINGSLV